MLSEVLHRVTAERGIEAGSSDATTLAVYKPPRSSHLWNIFLHHTADESISGAEENDLISQDLKAKKKKKRKKGENIRGG